MIFIEYKIWIQNPVKRRNPNFVPSYSTTPSIPLFLYNKMDIEEGDKTFEHS